MKVEVEVRGGWNGKVIWKEEVFFLLQILYSFC